MKWGDKNLEQLISLVQQGKGLLKFHPMYCTVQCINFQASNWLVVFVLPYVN